MIGIANATICYQAQATAANACGALAGGSYSKDFSDAAISYINVNWKIPSTAIGALIDVSYSNMTPYNITLNQSDLSASYLNFRIGFTQDALMTAQPQFYNNSVWTNIGILNTSYANTVSCTTRLSASSLWHDNNYTTHDFVLDDFWASCSSPDGGNVSAIMVNDVSIYWILNTTILNVSIFREDNLSLQTQFTNVTLTDLTNPSISNTTTNSGYANFGNVRSGDAYILSFSSQNFTSRSYYFIASDTNFSAYLLSANANSLYFVVYDNNGAFIPNLILYSYALKSSSYVLVESHLTDIKGKSTFWYNQNTFYRFCPVKAGYSSDCFNLNPPNESFYDVTVWPVYSTSYIVYNISGSTAYHNASHILNFSYISNELGVTNYSYTVSRFYNGGYSIICSNASGQLTGIFSCNLTGYTGSMYVQGVANNSLLFYDTTFVIPSSTALKDKLTGLDAALIAFFLLAIMAFAGIIFGILGALASTCVGVLVMYWLGILSPLNDVLVAIVFVVSIIIYAGSRRSY